MFDEIKCWEKGNRPNRKVPVETGVTIRINGRKLTTAMISPSKKKEFVIGHLLSQGIVEDEDEIESIRINKNEASVVADNIPFEETKEVLGSGCGAEGFDGENLRQVESKNSFSLDKIVESMFKVLEIGKDSFGTHVAGLFTEEQEFIARDIGRHNCIDKIIGMAVLEDISLNQSYIVSTGRMSSDMVIKCSNTNIPVSASHKSTTSLAIELANKANISLIISVGGDNSIVCNPSKINY